MKKSRGKGRIVAGVGCKRKLPDGTLVLPPDACCDTSDTRVVDLRPDGIECVPALEWLHRKSAENTSNVEHVHDGCVEIVFCRRGELVFKSMGVTYPFRPGMVFVSRPDEPHMLSVYPRGMSIYTIQFLLGNRGRPMLGLSARMSDCIRNALISFPRRIFMGGDEVRRTFQRLFCIYDMEKGGRTWRKLRLMAAVLDMLLAVIDAASASCDHTASDRLSSVAADIRTDPTRPLMVDDLAARMNLSPSHLIRLFKDITGLPPLAFRNACRIECAKRELADSRRSIMSIALRLGYSSTQNFTTSFRLATGQTPNAWRRQCLDYRQSNN